MTIIFLTVGISNVKAVTPTPIYSYKLIWNIESIYYYLTPNAVKYSSYISAAANNWVYTGYGYNKLFPNTQAGYITDSAIDFYTYSDNYTLTIAKTRWFARTNVWTGTAYETYAFESDWLYSEIHINEPEFNTLSASYKQGTITHEFGHVWGLQHNQTNPYSIMCQVASGRIVNTVQQVDNDAFNSKY